MFKISELCKMFNLSRSTLLYYDSIGLLTPSARTEANYRLYSNEDLLRLEKICTFRKAGLPLDEIKQILEYEDIEYSNILMDRFNQINTEIQDLKKQQACIASMLKNNDFLKTSALITKQTWNKLMNSAGFDENAAKKWHTLFEQISPSEHTIFLESLGLSRAEIEEIKQWSK
ncbi:MAG TPA: MerR family transcriptional regulator [Selenomonadales bacterium]|nr:MerR family transcriptional regulator [Selenomonadales bacterium]